MAFLMFFEKRENVFGNSFINIWLKNVAVAAARAIELLLRCNNKEGKKRRCL